MTVNLMDAKNLKETKRSNTLIILGSGTSINDMPNNFWTFCQRHDTLALNHWIYHWFIPTYWSIEISKNEEEVHRAWKKRIDERGKELYKDVIWITNVMRRPKAHKLLRYLDLDTNLYVYKEKGIMFDFWLRKIRSTDMLFDCKKILTFAEAQASLFRVLSLFYQLHYKRIIFAGVDLYNCLYFWSNYDMDVHIRKSINRLSMDEAKKKKHMTQSGKYKIVDIINHLNEGLFERKGVKLYVVNKDSCLYPTVEYLDLKKLR